MIICKYSFGGYTNTLSFKTLEEAKEALEESEMLAYCEELAETIHEVVCDINSMIEGDDSYVEKDELGNLIFER